MTVPEQLSPGAHTILARFDYSGSKAGGPADVDTLGVSAYLRGYPLVRMERIKCEYIDVRAPQPGTSYRAPLKRIGWATELATPAAKDLKVEASF